MLDFEGAKASKTRPTGVRGPLARPALNELARQASDGDSAATHALLHEVAPIVRRTCRGVLGAEHRDLEDAIQESLVAFIQALSNFRFDGEASRYAVRIAFRVALGSKRRSMRHRDRFRLTAQVEQYADSFSSLPCEDAIATQRQMALRSVFQKLPSKQAEVLTLRIMLGLSMGEIASMCDVPRNTIKTRLRRGKDALRGYAEQHAVLRCSSG